MDSINYLSRTWQYTPLRNKVYASQLPKISGVYMISVGNSNEFKPLYVGSSRNINKRVCSHFTTGGMVLKAKKIYRLKDLMVLFSPVIEDWGTEEKRIINLSNPEFNGHYKSDYNYTNCRIEDYKKLCLDIKKLMDGRRKNWLSKKMGITLPELSKKLNGLKSNRSLFFSKEDIQNINEVFKANLSLSTILET